MAEFNILAAQSRFMFFTGKGGVGKTSLSCAAALALADQGKRVLLVSTDPASNLDEMLGVELCSKPSLVPGMPTLWALNIDPEAASDAYRGRVMAQLDPKAEQAERDAVTEQLSGACTTEIAAFDEFVDLLGAGSSGYDHVIFDTAPTGHSLRLLSLPKAWTGFLEGNERGASCLGPHSGLKMQEERFRAALAALGDVALTTFVLVTRAERGAMREAARTAEELIDLGLSNQILAVNGVFHTASGTDAVAKAIERDQRGILSDLPPALSALPRVEVPLRSYDMVGLAPLRALLGPQTSQPALRSTVIVEAPELPSIATLVDELAQAGKGLIMVMGKGGVGKTTLAAAIAVGLAKRGHGVHLTTTDPAAHVAFVVEGAIPGLTVDRIDPEVETARYIDKVMSTKGATLDEAGKALLREDLASPCTEEVAVFHAFSRTVAEARQAFVVMDTAPTGHTLLLLDATGAYHRQMTRHLEPDMPGKLTTPMMRLQDPAYTHVVLATLPERTPVSEAAALQDDLRRAGIEPFAWVINRALAQSGTQDPLLMQRIAGEAAQIARVQDSLAKRAYLLPFATTPLIGITALLGLSLQGAIDVIP